LHQDHGRVLVVVDHQDALVTRRRGALRRRRSGALFVHEPDRRRQLHDELAALADALALGAHLAAVPFHEAAYDGEPETEPPARAIDGLRLLHEGLENARHHTRRDADALVLDADADERVRALRLDHDQRVRVAI